MGKYSDPGTGMSVAGSEAVYPLVAVAIDNNNKTSQGALKWAVEHLLKRGQTLVLVHVNTKGTSTGLVDSSGYKQPDAQLRELFLPYRCFCIRKDINCKDVVLDEMDVARALIEFAQTASIEIIVLGSPPKGMLRFKSSDVPQMVAKGAPDFCTVYIIGKEKISHQKFAIRAAPTVSPLRRQMGNPSVPKFESASATAPPKWMASKDFLQGTCYKGLATMPMLLIAESQWSAMLEERDRRQDDEQEERKREQASNNHLFSQLLSLIAGNQTNLPAQALTSEKPDEVVVGNMPPNLQELATAIREVNQAGTYQSLLSMAQTGQEAASGEAAMGIYMVWARHLEQRLGILVNLLALVGYLVVLTS